MDPGTEDEVQITQSALDGRTTGLGARALLRGVTTALAVVILLLGSGVALIMNWSRIFPPPPYRGPVVVGFVSRPGGNVLAALRGDTGHMLWDKPWQQAIYDYIWKFPGQRTIYVNDSSGHLYAIDPLTGQERWHSAVGAVGSTTSNAAIAGEDADHLLVIVFPQGAFGKRAIALLDRATGRTIWQQSVPNLETATLSAGVLLVTSLVADPQATNVPNTNLQRWDVQTGQVLWQTTIQENANCQVVSAAILNCFANISVSGAQHYTFLDATTGQQLWQHDSLFLNYKSATLAVFVDPVNNTNFNQFSAYTIQNGQLLWQRTVLYGDSFPLPSAGSGSGVSPLPGTPVLFVTSLHIPPESPTGEAAIIDLHTGQTIWQNPDLQLNFLIPIATTVTTLYGLSNNTAFYALQLADGSIKWSVPMNLHQPQNNLDWANDGSFFAFSGLQTNCIDGASGKVLWQVPFALQALAVIPGP